MELVGPEVEKAGQKSIACRQMDGLFACRVRAHLQKAVTRGEDKDDSVCSMK